jgi:hypothetical protein
VDEYRRPYIAYATLRAAIRRASAPPSDSMQSSVPTSDSMQPSVSTRPSVSRPFSSAAHGSCFPGVKHSRCATAAVTQPDKPFVKGIGNINCRRNAGSLHTDSENKNSATIVNTVKLNHRDTGKPTRFRRVAVNNMDYESVQPVGGASKRVHRPRTEAEKQRRREINRGPFSCPYSTRPPFQHRSGFGRHVILTHHMHCSWSRVIRPFVDEVNGIMSHLHFYVGALQGRLYSELTTQRRQPQELIDISDDSAVDSQ